MAGPRFGSMGKLTGDFPNLRFREVAHLKPNRIGFGLYTANKKVARDVTMWFDDVVVATEYIGPMWKQQKSPPLKPVDGVHTRDGALF